MSKELGYNYKLAKVDYCKLLVFGMAIYAKMYFHTKSQILFSKI